MLNQVLKKYHMGPCLANLCMVVLNLIFNNSYTKNVKIGKKEFGKQELRSKNWGARTAEQELRSKNCGARTAEQELQSKGDWAAIGLLGKWAHGQLDSWPFRLLGYYQRQETLDLPYLTLLCDNLKDTGGLVFLVSGYYILMACSSTWWRRVFAGRRLHVLAI
jgi:hypothetical protein